MVKTEKKCQKCGVVKCTSEFYIKKGNTKTGLKTYVQPSCKVCTEKRKVAWRKANRAKCNERQRERRQRKKLGIKPKPRQTYEERMAYKRKYYHKRCQSDPSYRLMNNLRTRLRQALKGKNKSAATQELLGICADECRKYIEAQFTEAMTWQNIHVDHIVPCASFDFTDPEQQRQCFHYTNLQPLLAKENLSKSAKITQQAAQREWNGVQWIE
jgi:hypothetical protein